MKTVWILLFCVSLAAQEDLATRLVNAPDEDSVARLLADNPSSVTPDLFEACRKAAQTALDRREHPDALRQFKAALAVAKSLRSDRDTAVALRGIGIAYRGMDRASQALASYEEGFEAATRSGDRAVEADLLRGIGVTHRNLGEFQQAIDADERSLAIYRELQDRHQIAAAVSNLAGNYFQSGDLRRAGELWEEAGRIGRNYPDVVNMTTSNLAVLAGQLGNSDASIAYLQQTNRAAEDAKDWHGLAFGLISIGGAYRRVHESNQAQESFNRGLALAIQTHDARLQAAALVDRAELYVTLNQRALAIKDLEDSLRISEAGDSKDTGVAALSNLASLELALGHGDKAFDYAQRAAAIAQEFQNPDAQWPAFDALGRSWLQKKDRVNARRWLEQSIATVEQLRSRAGGSEEDGQYFLETRITPYHDLLQLDLDEGLPEQALALAERAKARQLLDVVRMGKTEPAGSMTTAEIAEEHRLGANLSRLDQQLAGAADAKVRADIQKRLELAQREMEGFHIRLYMAHPKLAAQKGEGAPITLDQAAVLLPDAHTALVEFTSGEDDVYVFTIVRGAQGKPNLRTHTIRWPRAELTRDIDDLLRKLGARDLDYRESAERIYARLLGPLAAELRDSKLLVLVPDGPLWNLPFQALVGQDGRYLIERQAIFYAPSLTFLHANRQLDRVAWPNSRQILALGDPDSADLPETAREVRELVNLYGPASARSLTGDDALKASWERDAPNYRILHVATHGVLNAGNPMYSYLMFSGKSGSDKVLEAREVVNMSLHPDLVVLSACETGRGRVSIGEGLVGMSWAFLLAGARTTVVSQWKTDSAGTTRLMLGMHSSLKPVFASSQGFGRAASLQKAALALMHTPEYSHPFYWAGFVMVGDGY